MPMIEKNRNGLPLWHFKNLSACRGVEHFVSTRMGGCSLQPYDTLNLSFQVEDNPKCVLRNRGHLADGLGVSLSSLTTARQIHGSHITLVTGATRGRGSIDPEDAIADTDALITGEPGICLLVLVADCVPILLCDPSKGVIGAIHAGWKGTVQLIAKKTADAICREFGCSPESLVAGIGPSIGPCCYEVGPEVISRVEDVFGADPGILGQASPDGRRPLDLWQANLKQLLWAGIPERNIEMAKMCTSHHRNRFYSYRAEQGKTGRFGAGIVIR
jgi:YfiH family protein